MVKIVHFDAPGPLPESVFQRIGKEIEATSKKPEMQGASHEEVVKESLRAVAEQFPEIKEVAPAETQAPASPASPAPAPGGGTFPSYLTGTSPSDEEVRETVTALLTRVFEKGLEDAIAAAKRYDPFLEDAFHDALVEHLIPELRRRGILK